MDALYKYMKWNELSKETIKSQKIWYSMASSFNDPFECISDVSLDFRVEIAIALAIKHFGTGMSWEEMSGYISSNVIELHQNKISLSECFRNRLTNESRRHKENIEKVGILSLSEDPKNILLWSHYADSHKGVCIEFEIRDEEVLTDRKRCRKVSYRDNYPIVSLLDILTDDDLLTNNAIFTKSTFWSYEKEWRIWQEKGGMLYPTPGPIKSIILGCCWDDNIDDVIAIAKPHNATIYKAGKVEGRYELEIETEIEYDKEDLAF